MRGFVIDIILGAMRKSGEQPGTNRAGDQRTDENRRQCEATTTAVIEECRTAASKATTMGHIQRKHLTNAKVMVPSDELLALADAVIGPILERMVATALKARTLSTLRDTLLPRLISGQLCLPDAEAQVECAVA